MASLHKMLLTVLPHRAIFTEINFARHNSLPRIPDTTVLFLDWSNYKHEKNQAKQYKVKFLQ